MRQGAKQQRAKALRRAMTEAESKLWRSLRNRHVLGWKFRRQHPIGPFVVDFICLEAGVVVEADGGQHLDSDSDEYRDRFLQGQGLYVLRFWNHEVLAETEAVLARITQSVAREKLRVAPFCVDRFQHPHYVVVVDGADPARGRLKGNPVRLALISRSANSGAAPQR